MEALTVKELYTLDQTIAKDIFKDVTYPWEVLPKISSFIVELGNTLNSDEYEKRERMCGSQNLQRLLLLPISTDLRSSERTQRFVTARLSAAMRSSERALWSAILRSLRM